MTRRLLIDATHSEETRVAVVDDNYLEEFDYENKVRKQLKGNIFLAKVTRVEPSLQAAFVDYGGNRHGFLPFSEIHPDYFRIPVEDREALQAELAEEAEKQRAAEEEEDSEDNGDDIDEDDADADDSDDEDDADDEDEEQSDDDSDGPNTKKNRRGRGRSNRRGKYGRGRGNRRGRAAKSKSVEVVGGDDDGGPVARPHLRKKYKIQEVIKRGQIMLIQVSKEERGNKGAAVTTYLSMAGRYCVLMPNSPRAGGVSRKIPSFKERKRMRSILNELKISDGMSVIVRTAGVGRTKAEIKRDLDYLTRLWENTREKTLSSSAPELIHEEANLIKRTIRDLYTRDIEEVLVAGEEGHKEAKDFMKMMIPSHARRVKLYKDDKIPLFHRYQIESQISAIADPTAPMKSGGYLVINPTEALVSIDVNSGRATKERHIEETALNTNLEAADEVARQLRLRDLGGLVVIDFIDMEDNRNNRKVQKRMRDALSKDRARIQVGRISNFGLMELSRQRLNPSLTESQFHQCHHCQGVGYVRTLESTTLSLIRELEEEGIRDRTDEVCVKVTNEVALYILNNKRPMLAEIEERYGFTVTIEASDEMTSGQYKIEPLKDGGDRQDDRDKSTARHTGRDQESQGKKRGKRGGRKRGSHRDFENNDRKDQKASDEQDDKMSGKDSGKKRQDKNATRDDSQGAKKDDKKGKGRSSRSSSKEKKDADSKEEEDSSKKDKATRSKKSNSSDGQKTGRGKSKSEDKSGESDTGKPSKQSTSKSDAESGSKSDSKSGNDNESEKSADRKKATKKNKPEDSKSHPDEKVTVLPDTKDTAKKKQDKKKSASSDGSGRKGWWQRLVD